MGYQQPPSPETIHKLLVQLELMKQFLGLGFKLLSCNKALHNPFWIQ